MKLALKFFLIPVGLLLMFNIASLTVMPFPVIAASQVSQQRCDNFKAQFGLTNSTNVVTSSGLPVYCSASDLVLKAINYGLGFAGTLAVLFLIVGGFFYLASAGNEEQAEKGKKILFNSLIGLAVIILSFAIVKIVAGLLTTGK